MSLQIVKVYKINSIISMKKLFATKIFWDFKNDTENFAKIVLSPMPFHRSELTSIYLII